MKHIRFHSLYKLLGHGTMVVLAVALTGCGRPSKPTAARQVFTPDVVIKTTPVKDQGRSSLCWMYGMLATIESERLMRGDSVNLSPDYLARLWLCDEARVNFLTRSTEKISMRGMMTMVPHLMQQYGMQPYDDYHPFDAVNYQALCRMATRVARASVSLRMLNNRMTDILDKQLGYLPPKLYMLGMAYTPRQFAESILLPGDYRALTSFSHHPFGQSFVLECPDNKMLDRFDNIPIDQLMRVIVTTLRNGHPVCWEGDISEPGFDFKNGVATLTYDDQDVTQQTRQRAFEHFLTTDDHCMELCGLAHDEAGRRYFIAKNSWGRNNAYGGFMYLSYNYVKMKTIAVMVPTDYQHEQH